MAHRGLSCTGGAMGNGGAADEEEGGQQAALARLERAVAEFRAADTLQALYDSDVLAGLRQRVCVRWPALRDDHDQHHVISQGVDALVAELESRHVVMDPVAFIWRVVERRAIDEMRRKQRESPSDPRLMAGRVLPVLPADPGPAIREGRRLLPRIRGEKVRRALGMILEAIEQGRQVLPSREIAEALDVSVDYARKLRERAFDRLLPIARQEQAIGKGFELPELWDDEEDIRVAPDVGDGDDD
jgi:DNA-directed RNA polymerase specialized sigma24 family protein